MLDGEGGYTVWGKAQPLATAGHALPIGLAHGVALTRDVAAGEIVGFADVDLPPDDDVAALYRAGLAQGQQDAR